MREEAKVKVLTRDMLHISTVLLGLSVAMLEEDMCMRRYCVSVEA
jgi:hypothetical protein